MKPGGIALSFAIGLVAATGLVFWLAVQATREWQRSTQTAADTHSNEVDTLLALCKTEGWITFLHQLKFAIERRPGATRRTLYFAGSNESGRDVAAELELPGGPAADTAFDTALVGEHVKGEVWFRSEHQLGITVDAWGDGLLVVSSTGPTEDKPDGAATAILSTYGLDDDRLAELSARWTPWWGSRFPAVDEFPPE